MHASENVGRLNAPVVEMALRFQFLGDLGAAIPGQVMLGLAFHISRALPLTALMRISVEVLISIDKQRRA